MTQSDSNSKWPAPALGSAAPGVAAVSKTLQVFIDELSQLTQKNFEQTARVMEDLRNARSMGDLLNIQSKFVQETFDSFNERLRRMSTLMAELPAEFSQLAGSGVAQQIAQATGKPAVPATNKVGETPPH